MTQMRRRDPMDPARASALWATLGQARAVETGEPLPPFFHHLYFWEAQVPDRLGPDGHPKVGGLIPDLGLPRRMWAGGDLRFLAPLRAGLPAERRSTCHAVTRKTGRSGPLGFVTLRHVILQGGELCVEEDQHLVYRAAAVPGAAPPAAAPARSDEDEARAVTFDSMMLFRYSALTFNGHRIHHDLDYAREVEGYSGLVVHGPLLAQLLMLLAAESGALGRFGFRAVSPLMHDERATLCRKDADFWVRGPDGRLILSANTG